MLISNSVRMFLCMHEHVNMFFACTCWIHAYMLQHERTCQCLCMRTADGCYLTDVGADAGLPEALTAELHCHLTAHSVLLTDLLKSFLPNNQSVNYWSAGAQPSGTAPILKTPPHPHPLPLLSLLLPQQIGWHMQSTETSMAWYTYSTAVDRSNRGSDSCAGPG